jgi:endoglucanase
MNTKKNNLHSGARGESSTWILLFLLCGVVAALLFWHFLMRVGDSGPQVRVNQIGYETGSAMRAYLMLKGTETGSKFFVVRATGETLATSAVGAAAGKWGHYTVYTLDFTIATPGIYRIEVSGPLAAKSPEFRVDGNTNLYSGALTNALSFYQNQRDGEEFVPSALRTAAAHLNDKFARAYATPEFSGREGSRIRGDLVPAGTVINASGGWWDAGDYLKFVHTTSYVVALMLLGVRDFPGQMGGSSPNSDFTKEAKFGLDWLLRMWDDKTQTLCYQVGIGSGISGSENDHSIWRLPQEDDTYRGTDAKGRYIRNRPVFVAGPGGSRISPNLAGRLAGDFALCYRIFKKSDANYANRCLAAGEKIFDLADTSPGPELLTAAPHDFYDETEWRDDLEFGATELYLATRAGELPEGLPHRDADFYLAAAAKWASAYMQNRGKSSGVLGVADVSGIAHFDLYRSLTSGSSPAHLDVAPEDLLKDLRKTLDEATSIASNDPFGYGIPWGHGDTPSQGAGIVVLASEYNFLKKDSNYRDASARWLGNILGSNAWGTSFIVGDGTTFPHCIHHQVASLLGSRDGREPMLAGALVEGPIEHAESGAPRGVPTCPPDGKDPYSEYNRNGATYRDNVKYYSTNEPAIDLTAPSFLAFAWRIAGAPVGTP